MKSSRRVIIDGNEAAASVAYRLSEVIAIYPITPSSAMGELSDEWAAHRKQNVWGTIPQVIEMQSEGGAAGAVHGAVQAGSLATTFTASQGLLLMIPNMYKIAGELTPFTMHVAARTVATHALSIFGDHSDVMACRQTGFAFLASGSVQEAHDLALVAHATTLNARIPFLHFFDGFRTSHELARIDELSDEVLKTLVEDHMVESFRKRALTPERPVLRGSAQNPDVFFQARESANVFYDACPELVQATMDRLYDATGRSYHLFDYVGHPEAERVTVLMGSGTETAEETVRWLAARGEKVGLVKVRLYRPFSISHLIGALPATTRTIAVLDRTKEPGATGEPLYLDVVAALAEARELGLKDFRKEPVVLSGRYGLSSKEFTPAMVNAVYEEMKSPAPKRRFTVGIMDDVTKLSLAVDPDFDIESPDVIRAVFYGLGADGTVSANKNSVKIIGEETELCPQGYFVYDSKKSGAVTISHLRFGPRPIRAPYLIRQANFVACHQPEFLERYEMLETAAPGATFLVNAPYGPAELWDRFPREIQEQILEKNLKVYVIDAVKVARETGMGSRINTIMQVCFLALSKILPTEEAIEKIKTATKKTYGRRGEEVVKRNLAAIDAALANLHAVEIPGRVTATRGRPPVISPEAPDFVQKVTSMIVAGKGDLLPVSAFPPDGTWPVGTAKWEKRNIAVEIPVWDEKICIQCNKCAFVCPHAAIRTKIYPPDSLNGSTPPTFKAVDYKAGEPAGYKYTVQVAPEDCTGCTLCVAVCPAKDKANPRHKSLEMKLQLPLREQERKNYDFFLELPEIERETVKLDLKGSQFLEPLFEYSGACSGCGETPYLKLLTQLYGDRALIANATGCSSIYGGNLPTTPYTSNRDGRGPAWSNSLFEDNAEFGLGFRLAVDKQHDAARELLLGMVSAVGHELAGAILNSDQRSEAEIAAQRRRVVELREKLRGIATPEARRLDLLADALVRKSVWIVGGDGWAYDIGFGGLDHVLASGRDVNMLVLDTEVFSNTGGQQSKATPLGASAKFATAGKAIPKKDLALIALTYGHVYVARVAFGAKDAHTVKVFEEAESYPGPSLIVAYSHCIAHGYDMAFGLEQQKLAVDSGSWPLFRYDPRLAGTAEGPLKLDSPAPKTHLSNYFKNEARFRVVDQQDHERYRTLLEQASQVISERYDFYEGLSRMLKSGKGAGVTER